MAKVLWHSRVNMKGWSALFLLGLAFVALFVAGLGSTVLTRGVTKALISRATFAVRIDGVTMEPTLLRDSTVLVNKLAYEQQAPKRGDIVVYKPPTAPTRLFIHRVIGLPTEKVQIREGKAIVNGVTLTEPHVATPATYEGEWKLNDDEYFVLGDNRTNSLDSHVWGPLPGSKILGRADAVYWPPSRWENLVQSGIVP